MRFGLAFFIIFSINFSAKAQDSVFSFLAAGHLFGKHENQPDPYAAHTFLSATEKLNASGAKYFFGLGDLVQDSRASQQWDSLFNRLNKLQPKVSLLPGNHDNIEPNDFENFVKDKTSFFFDRPAAFFLISGFPENEIEFENRSLLPFQNVWNSLPDTLKPKDVFLLCHVPGFLLEPEFKSMFSLSEMVNAPLPDYEQGNNPWKKIIPFLWGLKTKTGCRLHFIFGDVGTPWSIPYFLDSLPNLGVYLAGAGLYDTPKDALLNVQIQNGKSPIYSLFPLGDSVSESIEGYNLKNWKAHFIAFPREQESYFQKAENLLKRNVKVVSLVAGFLLFGIVFFLFRKKIKAKKN